MRSARRKLLTCAVLVLYSSISLLGHALHWLSPEDHHHHPTKVAHAHGSSHIHEHCGQHDHTGCEATHEDPRENALAITASDYNAHLHACDICAFLDQVKSQQPQLAATIIWQRVVGAAPSPLQPAYVAESLGLHAPRGPPLEVV